MVQTNLNTTPLQIPKWGVCESEAEREMGVLRQKKKFCRQQ